MPLGKLPVVIVEIFLVVFFLKGCYTRQELTHNFLNAAKASQRALSRSRYLRELLSGKFGQSIVVLVGCVLSGLATALTAIIGLNRW